MKNLFALAVFGLASLCGCSRDPVNEFDKQFSDSAEKSVVFQAIEKGDFNFPDTVLYRTLALYPQVKTGLNRKMDSLIARLPAGFRKIHLAFHAQMFVESGGFKALFGRFSKEGAEELQAFLVEAQASEAAGVLGDAIALFEKAGPGMLFGNEYDKDIDALDHRFALALPGMEKCIAQYIRAHPAQFAAPPELRRKH